MSEENNETLVSEKEQNFEGQQIKVAMTQKPGCQVMVEVEVSPEATKAAHSKAIKKINKEVSLPGFRKGKAPERLIVSNYGKYIDQEWRELVLSSSFHDAMSLTKVYPLGERSIKKSQIEDLSLEDGAKVTFEYESEPQIPELNFEEMKMEPAKPAEVTEEDVEQRLLELKERHTTWKSIEEDRPAEENDSVELDIFSIDEEPAKELCKDTRFKVSEDEMGGWLRKLVIGMKKGDAVEGVSELDESADESVRENFKPTQCKVVLKGIVEEEKIELDDEFAKKMKLQDMDELRQKIREQLEEEAKKKALEDNRKKVQEIILDNVHYDVPASMLENERKARIRERIKQLKDAGESDEDIAAKESQIESEVAVESDKALRMFFLTRHLSGKYDLKVSDEELKMAVMRYQIYNQMMQVSEDDEELKEVQSQMHMNLLIEKVEDFVIAKISVAD
ncbi:MAG: trigger factor [Chlamydiota bacterium]